MSEAKKPKEKAVLIDLGNVRIREYDNMNVQIERAEGQFDDEQQKVIIKWKSKGYYANVGAALKAIVMKELMLDKNALNGLKSYLKQIEESNAKVLQAIERGVKG